MAEEKELTQAEWWAEDADRLNALAEAASAVAAKTPSQESVEGRSLTISIDFDRTFAADPDLWGDFAESAVKNGDTVVMISRRDDTEKNRDHIAETLGDYGEYFTDVLLIGTDTQKETAAEDAGIDVDVWIDDAPHTISNRAFCPTGVGGGVDNSCSSKDGGGIRESEVTQAALSSIAKTGGFSVHPATASSPTTGYMVSVVPESETILDSPDDITETAVKDFYDRNKKLFEANPALHLGGWVDRTTGKTYFDLSARFEDLDDAIDEAVDRKQLAIWDLNAGKEIRQEEYDGRRTRPKGTRPRSVRLPAGDVAEGDRGLSEGVRKEGDRGDAEGRDAKDLRAFCPTGVGGGIDNSCSSKDGSGGGGLTTGMPPAPPPPASPSKIDRDDPRGRITGHTREQRKEYAAQVSRWLNDNFGIVVNSDRIGGDPPSMDALRSIADGVNSLDKLGFEKPKTIIIEDQPDNCPAAYEWTRDRVMIDPDLDEKTLQLAMKEGRLAGRTGKDAGASLVHEIAHRDHAMGIARKMGEDPKTAFKPGNPAYQRVIALMGNPHPMIGPLTDPFHPDARFSHSTTGRGSSPVSGDDARKIAYEVSSYATMNPLEFVAEVRTGVSKGVQYSPQVMSLYEDYNGPPLPSVKGRKVKSVNSKKTPPWEEKKPARRPRKKAA